MKDKELNILHWEDKKFKLAKKTIKKICRLDKASFEDLECIDNLSHKVYSLPNNVPSDMVNRPQLRSWYESSPESWLIYKNQKGIIEGFIHVEIICKSIATDIINGKCDESNIKSEDKHILKYETAKKEDFIHIGSIVADPDSKNYYLPLILVCGIVDRILDIRNGCDVDNVIAVNYCNNKGVYSAEKILKRLGMQDSGHRIKNEESADRIYLMKEIYKSAPFFNIIERILVNQRAIRIHKINQNRIFKGNIRKFMEWVSDFSALLNKNNKKC